MNITKPLGYSHDVERRAEALADIQRMHEELNAAHETIGQLKADLARAEDRMTLTCEERNKYRAESLIFRSKLIELATAMSNIGLLTQKAQDFMATVNELTVAASPTDEQLVALEARINAVKVEPSDAMPDTPHASITRKPKGPVE